MGTSNDQPQNVASISDEEKQSTLRKVVFSSFLGNFIEWFDYGSYSYFAAVIGAVFFPADDPLITTVNAFAVFPSASCRARLARCSGAAWVTRRVASGRFR